MDGERDIIIIGAGPGGYEAALHAARRGLKPLLIEKNKIGGTCLNRGCIPTKCLLASTGLLAEAKGAAEYGVCVKEALADFGSIVKRKDSIVSQLLMGLGGLLKSWGVEVVSGNASFKDKNTVEVVSDSGSTLYKSNKIIISTGSVPATVGGLEVDGDGVVNSDHVLGFTEVPGSMLIVGAGAIGMEFACIYSMLGTKVTVVEMLPNIVPLADTEVSSKLRQALEKTGITIKTGTVVKEITDLSGRKKARIEGGGVSEEIVADKILVATGRVPFTEGLCLENAGVKTAEKGKIAVNDKLETSQEGIYAIGDVTGGIQLAHVASEEGITAVDNAAGGQKLMDYSVVPNCVYSIPQLAWTGITEEEAKKKGINYSAGRFPFAASGKALVCGKRTGMIKVLAESVTKKVLGIHILGHEATEIISQAVITLKAGLTTESFTRIIHAHPTLYESMHDAMDDVWGMSIGLARKKK